MTASKMSFNRLMQHRLDYVCCSWFSCCSATEMNHSAMLVAPLQECKLTMSSCCFASPVRVAAALSEHALAVPQYPSAPSGLHERSATQTPTDAHAAARQGCAHHLCSLRRNLVFASVVRQPASACLPYTTAVSRDCQTALPDAADLLPPICACTAGGSMH